MRVLLRVLSPFLGLAVAGVGALVVASVGSHWSGREWPATWPATWPGWSWVDRPVLVAGWCAAIGGASLLVLALRAGVSQLALDDPAAGVRVVTTPLSVARLVGHRVRSEDGVSGASVTASRRRVRVRATSRVHDEASLRPRLLAVARSVVDDLPMPVKPEVSVVVVSPKDRAAGPLDVPAAVEEAR